MKKLSALILAMVLLFTLTTTAFAAYTPGTYSATAPGFGGDVTVTVTVDENQITDVKIVGDKETVGIGGTAVQELPAVILEAQSADFDGWTGASFTSAAVKAAVGEALAEASGEANEIPAANMKDGRYVAYADSFHPGDGLTVTVEINENAIRTIEVDTAHTSDMDIILDAAVRNLVPRMVEYQSVSVDAVCGATVSSNAIKNAVKDCVEQALAAGGSDPEAIQNFYISIPSSNRIVDMETEVLVVGMGGSGIATATSAAQNGLKVLAIDKAGRFGGSSSLTCDVFALNPPQVKAEKNNGEDYESREAILDNWITYCEGDAKQEIVEKYLDGSGEMLDWLVHDFDMLDPWIAGPAFYSIWSDTQINKIAEEGFDALNGTIFFGSGTCVDNGVPIPNTDKVLDAAVAAGIMVKADSIEDLAAQLGMEPETLVKTVETYNGYCEAGVDEQFGKPAEFLDKVEGETYYAVKMFSYAYGSCGGLDINEHFQVLKTDGETAINGLYAVGTDSMGVLFTDKKPYVTYGGVNISWGLTSGMLLGRELAEAAAVADAA